jgi:hypothetical protein
MQRWLYWSMQAMHLNLKKLKTITGFSWLFWGKYHSHQNRLCSYQYVVDWFTGLSITNSVLSSSICNVADTKSLMVGGNLKNSIVIHELSLVPISLVTILFRIWHIVMMKVGHSLCIAVLCFRYWWVQQLLVIDLVRLAHLAKHALHHKDLELYQDLV